MEGLRLILLVVGALIIGGVYAYSRWGSRPRSADDPGAGDAEPHFGNVDPDEEISDDLPTVRVDDDAGDDLAAEPAGRREEKIIVLNIMPLDAGATFPGADLLDVFDRAGLEYGQYDIFHRIKETANGPQGVFSVANATEPGSFDITRMAEESFRGLSLFMLLPGPVRGVDAFADMLATARRIAEQIRGEVTDRNRSTLTRQTARHVREEIIAFEHHLTIKS